MALNLVRDVTFRPVAASEDLPAGGRALFLSLEIGDPGPLAEFLAEVVARFKAAQLLEPPGAAFMLVTVVGDISPPEFALAWDAATSADPEARALLGFLRQADVMQANREGHIVGQTSLLPARAEIPERA